MKNIIIFDDNDVRKQLLPITYTRPITKIRVGITTIEEKWQALLGQASSYSYLTASYLKKKFPTTLRSRNLLVAGHVIPTPQLARQALGLKTGEAIVDSEGQLIAFYGSAQDFDSRNYTATVLPAEPPKQVTHLWNIFQLNGEVLRSDFERITAGRQSQPVPPSCTVIGDPSQIFIEKGACIEGSCLNTKEGPIYIGENVEVMEGACVRGPFAACHDAKVRIGAKVYGATTLGPYCKIGGEVENTVMIGYSNKAHEGFLGDAVIGEWCNIGGGTTASNLKNDYSEIRLWNYATQRFDHTGLQFCGPIMGDHCKTGVNCMLNTATVLGVGVNVYGAGFPRNFVASFMEGGNSSGFKDVKMRPFLATVKRVMARRGIELTPDDCDMLEAIYKLSKKYK